MPLVLKTPTKLYIEVPEKLDYIRKRLTYTDQKAVFDLRKAKKSYYLLHQLGEERYAEHLQELAAKQKVTLLWKDDVGYYTYSGLAKALLDVLPGEYLINEVTYPEEKLIPWNNKPYPLRDYQQEALESLLKAKHGAVEIGCHRKGERVLLHSGLLKKVEDISVGDEIMGPDNTPRLVQELKRGVDVMYLLETVNGQKMYINGHHLLVLQSTCRDIKNKDITKKRSKTFKGANPIKIISVNDYLLTSKKYKHLHKIISSTYVEFKSEEVPIDPYMLGLLLGDGHLGLSDLNMTSMDQEIIDYCYDYASKNKMQIYISKKDDNQAYSLGFSKQNGTIGDYWEGQKAGRGHTRLMTYLEDLGLRGKVGEYKFIPQSYKANSKKVRLEILAGLIDTDGSLSNDGCTYDYISKSELLAEDVCFIVRSLGMRATVSACQKADQNGTIGDYFRVCISGNTDQIPVLLPRKKANPRRQIKSPNRFGFTVTKVSDEEEYYGFVLDKDHQYLTDTFLITHNTGLGKSEILAYILKELGLKSVVMAPSVSIAVQLYDRMVYLFGKKYVGFVGDGKKEYNKQFVVAISASLTKLTEDSVGYEALSKTQCLICDESHLTAAETLDKVCNNLFSNTPYRFFFSGTQLRNDGKDMLLEGITSSIVYSMTVREGVDRGFLAKPIFSVVEVVSDSDFQHSDVNEITRKHLFYNTNVNKAAADIANKSVKLLGKKVLILIEEISQFEHILPYLEFKTALAHGGVTAANKDKVPKEFHKSDPKALVQALNEGDLDILVGTSCVAIGTDFRSVGHIIYLMGGKSEVKIRQAIGRGTRLVPGKNSCLFTDFDVVNEESCHRHAQTRQALYSEVYAPPKVIKAM